MEVGHRMQQSLVEGIWISRCCSNRVRREAKKKNDRSFSKTGNHHVVFPGDPGICCASTPYRLENKRRRCALILFSDRRMRYLVCFIEDSRPRLCKSRLYFSFQLLSVRVSSRFQVELCSIFKSMSWVDCDSFFKSRDRSSFFAP